MEDQGLARGKFEVAETKIKAYKAQKTKEASSQNQKTVSKTDAAIETSPWTYADLSVGVQLYAAVSAVSHDRLVLDLPFGMQAIADVRAELTVGQFVPVVVVSVDVRGTFREVRVSLDPSVLNASLKPEKRMVLSAVVKSVEAHGYALTFSPEISGFLSLANSKGAPMKSGHLLTVAVQSVPRPNFVEAAPVNLADNSAVLAGDRDLKIGQVRVGFTVHCRVIEQIESSGDVVVSFLRSMTGIVNRQYLSGSSGPLNKNDTFTARIVGIDRQNKFRLSQVHAAGSSRKLSEGAIGRVVKMRVKYVVAGQYVMLGMKEECGQCHFSRGGKTMKVEDGERRVKVIGENRFDGVWIVSGEKKVVESEIVTVADVVVGEVYVGKISQVDNNLGVIVELSEFISGRVPKEQLFDVVMKKPNMNMFQKGMTIKVRVLNVDLSKRQVLLTAKKAIVSAASDCKANITANSQTAKDDILVGYVRNTNYVNFCGDAFGILSADKRLATLQDGCTVKVRVAKTPGRDDQPLKLSLDLGLATKTSASLVGGRPTEWRCVAGAVEVKMEEASGGWLQAKLVEAGSRLEAGTQLVVVGVESDGTLLCSGKQWVVEQPQLKTIADPTFADSVQLAYVTRVLEKCLFVSLGLFKAQSVVLAKDMGDSFIENATVHFAVGQSVLVRIKADQSVSLRKSEIAAKLEGGHLATVLLTDILRQTGATDWLGRRISSFTAKTQPKPYGHLLSSAEEPNWTLVVLNENNLLDSAVELSDQHAQLVVIDRIADQQILQVLAVPKSNTQTSVKKRKLQDANFQVRLNSCAQYCVVYDASADQVGVFYRTKADRDSKLELGAAVPRLKPLGTLAAVTLLTGSGDKDAKKPKLAGTEVRKLEVGQTVDSAVVKRIHGFFVDLEISGVAPNKTCRAHFVDLPGAESLRENDIVQSLVVCDFKRKQNLVWLGAADHSAEEATGGVVIGSSLKGVFVALTREKTGRIALKAMRPRPQSEAAVLETYPIGKRLHKLRREVDEVSGNISLFPGSGTADIKLVIGNVVSGVVSGKKKYGLFVDIADSTLSALCPVKDCGGDQAMATFQLNQRVHMEITKLDNNKIWGALANQAHLVRRAQGEEADDEHEEVAELVQEDDSASELHMELEDEEDEADSGSEDANSEAASSEAASCSSGEDLEEASTHEDAEVGLDAMEEDALEDSATAEKKKKKKKRAAGAVSTGAGAEKPSLTADEYEKQLLGVGAGSVAAWELWTAYAGLYVRLGEVEQARRILKRGISAAETETGKTELFTVWLNLEAHYGTSGEVEKVFGEAVTMSGCDSKEMHKRMSGVWRRAGNWEEEKRWLERLVKKHKHSRKCWVLFVERLFENELAEEARQLIASKVNVVLATHKQVRFQIKVGIIEMTHSFTERGVTIFEDLIAKYPKKLDIVNVYLDQLAKGAAESAAACTAVRTLFRRVCMGMKLKPQSVLGFFKKWVLFEETHGNVDTLNNVQVEAQKYVASL